MTRESKDLLLKDLCARLPYGVMVNYGGYEGCDYELTLTILQDFPIEDLKPYLRPMSSMTEEEKIKLSLVPIYASAHYNEVAKMDWLLANHFDFRGLIEKGLAISTEVFNPYKD